jgi:hypothetical protein
MKFHKGKLIHKGVRDSIEKTEVFYWDSTEV